MKSVSNLLQINFKSVRTPDQWTAFLKIIWELLCCHDNVCFLQGKVGKGKLLSFLYHDIILLVWCRHTGKSFPLVPSPERMISRWQFRGFSKVSHFMEVYLPLTVLKLCDYCGKNQVFEKCSFYIHFTYNEMILGLSLSVISYMHPCDTFGKLLGRLWGKIVLSRTFLSEYIDVFCTLQQIISNVYDNTFPPWKCEILTNQGLFWPSRLLTSF